MTVGGQTININWLTSSEKIWSAIKIYDYLKSSLPDIVLEFEIWRLNGG